MTVEFGENGHFAANLAPETMSIDFFFFLTGSSDVNSDSSDAHSASVTDSNDSSTSRRRLIYVNLCFHLYLPSH